MTFDKIHIGITFSCVDSCDENTSDTFVRKMTQSDVTESCFLSKWEEGYYKTWKDALQCCQSRGVSVNIIPENAHGPIAMERAVRTYQAVREIKRQNNYTHLCKFKFKDATGKVQETRTSKNPTHHTLYKADDFAMEKLEIIAVEIL